MTHQLVEVKTIPIGGDWRHWVCIAPECHRKVRLLRGDPTAEMHLAWIQKEEDCPVLLPRKPAKVATGAWKALHPLVRLDNILRTLAGTKTKEEREP